MGCQIGKRPRQPIATTDTAIEPLPRKRNGKINDHSPHPQNRARQKQ
ncbi:MAG: hypothetical protein Q4G63_08660 [Bacteroidia bacterium]|nr:hypothetical protein [Bacteroidia bacterium]